MALPWPDEDRVGKLCLPVFLLTLLVVLNLIAF